MSRFVFRYHVASDPQDLAARAEALLVEQTVELSRAAVSDPWVRANIIGEILLTEPLDDGRFAVAIAQPASNTQRNQRSQT